MNNKRQAHSTMQRKNLKDGNDPKINRRLLSKYYQSIQIPSNSL